MPTESIPCPTLFAEYSDCYVVVYQAFKTKISKHAIERQDFAKGFGLNRMSWIKTSFAWLLQRSDYARKRRQTSILKIFLSRAFFDEVVENAHPSWQLKNDFVDPFQWRRSIDRSLVIAQWDPDLDFSGRPSGDRAIQLGLRGSLLSRYATEAIIKIEDVTAEAKALLKLKQERRRLPDVEGMRAYPLSASVSFRLRWAADKVL